MLNIEITHGWDVPPKNWMFFCENQRICRLKTVGGQLFCCICLFLQALLMDLRLFGNPQRLSASHIVKRQFPMVICEFVITTVSLPTFSFLLPPIFLQLEFILFYWLISADVSPTSLSEKSSFEQSSLPDVLPLCWLFKRIPHQVLRNPNILGR